MKKSFYLPSRLQTQRVHPSSKENEKRQIYFVLPTTYAIFATKAKIKIAVKKKKETFTVNFNIFIYNNLPRTYIAIV